MPSRENGLTRKASDPFETRPSSRRRLNRGLLVLAALWWAWTGYAWLTNLLEPEETPVRTVMFAAMAAMLVVALAVPDAFGAYAVLFGVAYLIVRLLQLLLFAAQRACDSHAISTPISTCR